MKLLARLRPSPAMVIACIALIVALGGTSVAAIQALPKNSVGTKQLKKNAVTSPKVKNNTLTGADVNEGTLGTVPSATNASNATNATNAANAANAANATNATNAGNANTVGGFAPNQLSRAATGGTGATTALNDTDYVTYGTVSLTAPRAGYVTVISNVVVLNQLCTSGCTAFGVLRDLQSGVLSSYFGEEDALGQEFVGFPMTWTFAVTAGSHTFENRLQRFTGNGTLSGWWSQMSAIYTPFSATGTGSAGPSGGAPTTNPTK